jgi:hypothetical protein
VRRVGVTALTDVLTLILAAGSPVMADTLEFPATYTEYHTHAEMVAAIDAAVAAHPGIIKKFSIGQTAQGREIWAVKISDNVNQDEFEPEVLFEGLHHAAEHMATEMGVYLIELLTQSYGEEDALGDRVTDIVRNNEIYIVPMVNPDGAEWDISAGTGSLRNWRRNRQVIPGSDKIGIDLNRNWGYQWGCCGGSSPKPGAWHYRGPEPWYAPEVRALRDFVLSRVVNGRQQLRAALSMHTYRGSVMWPYGYTLANVPRTMTAADHAAFVAVGNAMAALNGYAPEQLSDMYILDGDATDWLYGEQRIFAMLIEMSFIDDPKGDAIAPEMARNRDAMLYFLEHAACPYRAAGTNSVNCGPLYDDFEASRGWTVNAHGTDTATTGTWERGKGELTKTPRGVKQRDTTPSGQAAFFSGRLAGAGPNANDVDGGVTSIRSPSIKLGEPGDDGWTLTFSYSFAHDARARSVDHLRVSVDGAPTALFIQRGAARNRNATWRSVTLDLDGFAGQSVRLLVEARDAGADSLVEAAVDDVRVYKAE